MNLSNDADSCKCTVGVVVFIPGCKMPPLVLSRENPRTPRERIYSLADGCFSGPKECWHVHIQGTVVNVFRTGVPHRPIPQSDKRCIGPWSYQSRKRLLHLTNTIDYHRLGKSVFVTLTYPDDCLWYEYKTRTQARSVFCRYVETHLGRHAACLWRIEWEERQSGKYTGRIAPHFHMMWLNVPYLCKDRVREWWRKTINAGPGPLVTDVRRIYGFDGVGRYVAAYVSAYRSLDVCTYLNSPFQFGAHWGLTRKSLVPRCPVILAKQLSADNIASCKRFGRGRWKNYAENGEGGFTLYGERAVKAFASLLGKS